jgi:dienelactone hydrolase
VSRSARARGRAWHRTRRANAILAAVAAALVSACTTPGSGRSPVIGESPAERTAPSLPTQVPGFVREATRITVVTSTGHASLEALVTRPSAPGPYPLVILTHGSPRGGAPERAEMSPTNFSAHAMTFARHGYAVANVMRRGFGRSDGPYVETAGPCEDRNYSSAARLSASDVLGTLDVLGHEPWVDRSRVLLVGHSAGGLAVLAAAATKPPGVVGVISFAGGRGSDAPDHICQESRLVAAFEHVGAGVGPPSLWVYAENDHYFSPDVAREFEHAYAAGGASTTLVLVPPFGDDGHAFFPGADTGVWWGVIQPFLSRVGLPTELVQPRANAALSPPAGLGPDGIRAFERYTRSDSFEKAFAVGAAGWGGGFGQRTQADAIALALTRCQARDTSCAVYAVGDDYAPGARGP